MNFDRMEAAWDQQKRIAERHWMDMKNDEMENIAGERAGFVQRLQEIFGISNDVARENMEDLKGNTDKPKKSDANSMELLYVTARRDKTMSRIPPNAKWSTGR